MFNLNFFRRQPTTTPPPEPCLTEGIDEPTIVARWLEVRAEGRSRRTQSREFRALRPELARLLIAKHAELAVPGRAGQFSRYLREIKMPRRTAYDLIQRFSPPAESAQIGLGHMGPPAQSSKSGTRGIAALGPALVLDKYPALNDLSCAIGRTLDRANLPALDWGGRTLFTDFDGPDGSAVYLRSDAAQENPHQWRGSKLPLKADAAVCWAMIAELDDPALRQSLHNLMLAPQWRDMSLPRSHPRLTLRHQPGHPNASYQIPATGAAVSPPRRAAHGWWRHPGQW